MPTYDVVTKFTVAGVDIAASQAGRAARQMQAAAEDLDKQYKRVGDTLASIGKWTLGLGAVGLYGGGKLIEKLIGSQGDLEQARLSIAGVLNATGAGDFASSMELGKKRLQELYDFAKTHVGTFEQYMDAFRAVLAPVRSAGGTSDQAAGLVEKLLPVAMAMGGKEAAGQLGYQLSEAISIGLQGRMAPELQRIARAAGITKEAFNALDAHGRIVALLRGAEKFGPMVAAGEKTLEAQTTTLESSLLSLGRTATQPLFEAWKSTLSDVNGWIEKNNEGLATAANITGKMLVDTLEIAKATTSWAMAHPKTAVAVGVGGSTVGGAGIGALIGSFILPGYGTLVGAGIGGGAGGGLSAYIAQKFNRGLPTEENRRADFMDAYRRLEEHLTAYQERNDVVGSLLKDSSLGDHVTEVMEKYERAFGKVFSQSIIAQQYGLSSLLPYLLPLPTAKDGGPKEATQKNKVEVNVVIKQDFRDVQDPDRIASLTAEAIKKIAMNPLQRRREVPFTR
jgi:hypothetical protein